MKNSIKNNSDKNAFKKMFQNTLAVFSMYDFSNNYQVLSGLFVLNLVFEQIL